MTYGILITSANYNGQIGDITFYPDTGGTVTIGNQLMPYTFYTDYYYGSFEIYFSGTSKTCYAYMDNPSTNFILQENYALVLQEDNSGILTEGTVTIDLTGEYSPGSINIAYVAISNLTLNSDVEISFVDTLNTVTGSSITLSGSVTITSGNTQGFSYYTIPEDYTNLTKVANFSDINYSVTGDSLTVLVQTNSEFDVTPTPTNTPTPTLTPSVTASPTSTITPTTTPTNTQTPTNTTTPTPTITPSSTPIPIVEDGLILDWDIQNTNSYSGAGVTLIDILGNSNGTLNGTIDYTSGNPSLGIPNYLLVEGGTTEYIVTNNNLNPYLNPANTGTNISYFLWVYPTGNGIILNEQGTTTPAASWHDTQIEIVSGQLKFRLWQLSSPYITSSTSLTLNTWNYVGLTYSGTTLIAYLNGENVGSVTGFSRLTPYNDGGAMGLYYSLGATDTVTNMGDGNGATFRFGAFHLYNKGLTASEVLQNYNTTKINYFPPVSPTPTTTQTPTPTNTQTPTNTPTPSSTPSPTIESFTSVGTTSWTAPAGVTSVEYLVVGGGGGGGNGYDSGGGGGAGGGMVLTGTLSVSPGNSYTVTVGGGGTGGADTRANNPGTDGSSSIFDSITATGGQGGYGSRTAPGGAGVGGAAQNSNITSGRAGNGGAGGNAGGGGGGAGGNGTNRISSSSAGVGGAGISSSISGSAVTYGGGGNGGTANVNNNNGATGAANTGKGGGAGSATGSNSGGGGNGGSGIVVLKYFA